MKRRKVKSLQGDSESSEKKKMTREKEISESGDQDNVLVIKSKKKSKVKLLNGNSDISKKKKEKKIIEADSENSKKKKKKKEETNGAKSEKAAKRRKKLSAAIKLKTKEEPVAEISLVDEDCSRGMKKWILAYHQRRPGLDVIQERINDFIASYEAEQEQVRRERETRAAEEGWTTVVHHKGRKKTTDSESGVVMGSVSQAAAEANRAKKKTEDLALDFYRFQKREAHKNELMMLQSKFEQDKKRLQQLRAARKFRPY